MGAHHLGVISFADDAVVAIEHGDSLRVAAQPHPPLAQGAPQIDRESRALLAPDEAGGKTFLALHHAQLAAQLKIRWFAGKRSEGCTPEAEHRKKYVKK
jgi:hypothetical protein